MALLIGYTSVMCVIIIDGASSRDKELEKHSGTKIELAQEVGKLDKTNA
jgi:hypothetical protein